MDLHPCWQLVSGLIDQLNHDMVSNKTETRKEGSKLGSLCFRSEWLIKIWFRYKRDKTVEVVSYKSLVTQSTNCWFCFIHFWIRNSRHQLRQDEDNCFLRSSSRPSVLHDRRNWVQRNEDHHRKAKEETLRLSRRSRMGSHGLGTRIWRWLWRRISSTSITRYFFTSLLLSPWVSSVTLHRTVFLVFHSSTFLEYSCVIIFQNIAWTF